MNLNCEIVQDLLPLYEDGVCSEATKIAVEEHLKTCPHCARVSQAVVDFQPPEIPETEEADKAVAKSFRKVRRRWWSSLIAALMVVLMILLCVNQVRHQGLCFTNVDDILEARRYAAALADGDWEKAAGLMDYETLYGQVMEILDWDLDHYVQEVGPGEDPLYHYDFNQRYYAEARGMTQEAFTEYVKKAYIADLKTLEAAGYTFQLTGFENAYYCEDNGGWTIVYGLNVSSGSQTRRLSLDILVRDSGLYIGAMSYSDLRLGQIDLAEVLFVGYPGE